MQSALRINFNQRGRARLNSAWWMRSVNIRENILHYMPGTRWRCFNRINIILPINVALKSIPQMFKQIRAIGIWIFPLPVFISDLMNEFKGKKKENINFPCLWMLLIVMQFTIAACRIMFIFLSIFKTPLICIHKYDWSSNRTSIFNSEKPLTQSNAANFHDAYLFKASSNSLKLDLSDGDDVWEWKKKVLQLTCTSTHTQTIVLLDSFMVIYTIHTMPNMLKITHQHQLVTHRNINERHVLCCCAMINCVETKNLAQEWDWELMILHGGCWSLFRELRFELVSFSSIELANYQNPEKFLASNFNVFQRYWTKLENPRKINFFQAKNFIMQIACHKRKLFLWPKKKMSVRVRLKRGKGIFLDKVVSINHQHC